MKIRAKQILSFILCMTLILTMPMFSVSANKDIKDIEKVAAVRVNEECVFNGLEQIPEVEVYIPDAEDGQELILEENIDYTIFFADNIDVGTARYTVQGIGKYSGTIEGTFEISPCDISKVDIEDNLENKVLEYNGKERTPVLILSLENVRLKPAVDYEVRYKNNTNAGIASIIITAIGENFTGSLVKKFSIIKKNISKTTIKITVNDDNTVVVKLTNPEAGKGLINGVDFTYTAEKDGKGYINVTIKASEKNYTGTVVKKVKANPEPTTKKATKKKIKVNKTKIVKVANSKKKVALTWKKIKGVHGYEIRYSTKKSMKKAKVKKIKKNVKKSNLKKIKRGKLYFVQIRAYKKVEKKFYYSKWSSKKKIKNA